MRRQPSQPRHNAGRWCSRALLVLGGAVAGTAAAWALSAAPASASTTEDPGIGGEVQPVAQAASAGFDDVKSGVSKLVGPVVEAPEHVAAESDTGNETENDAGKAADKAADKATDKATEGSSEAKSTGVADEVQSQHAEYFKSKAGELNSALRGFTDEAVLRPAGRTIEAALHILSEPQDAPDMIRGALTPPQQVRDFGEHVWDYFHRGEAGKILPLPNSPLGDNGNGSGSDLAPPVPGSSHTDAQAPVKEAAKATNSDAPATSHQVRGVPQQDSAHATQQHGDTAPQSPLSLPHAPLALPSVPGGTAGGSHVDSPQFGYPTAALSAFHPAAIGSVRTGVRSLLLQPEPQPGVTPD